MDGSTTSYTYNRFGQVLTETDALGQSETNTYSPLGRLETSTDRSGQTTVYTHDALGRVTATAAGTAHADTLSRSYTKTGQLLREERGWQRTDSSGAVTKAYTYDAFGVEQNPDSTDPNPFRYCGEYLDRETGTYYLRARYYSPEMGRFTQEDTHWNPANRLYGDEPQKINERTDKLGLKSYAYAPDITAVMQSGNLYAYCGGNPILYFDPNGTEWYHWLAGGLLVAGAAVAVVVTAGGITPALCAVGAVASGTSAATVSSTIAAGAFIGSSIAYGTAAIDSALSSKSIDEFLASSSWETVAFTAGGLLAGGASGYVLYSNEHITIVGKGSTGRVEAKNLNEQIAMKQVLSNPLDGATDLSQVGGRSIIMSDPRWPAEDGWIKMQNIVVLHDKTKIVIHFVYNYILDVYDDFKFVS